MSVVLENVEEGIPFVINLHAELLYQQILRSEDNSVEQTFFLITPSGDPLLYDEEDLELVQQVSALYNSTATTGWEVLHSRSGEYLINHRTIESLGWIVISAMKLEIFNTQIRPERIRVFLFNMLIIPLSMLLAFYLVRRLYDPIRSLTGYARGLSDNSVDDNSSDNNDLDLIMKTLTSSERREHELKEQLRESLPAYRDNIHMQLLSDHALSIDDILDRLNFIESKIDTRNLAVLVVSPGARPDEFLSASDNMFLGMEVKRLFQEYFLKEFTGEILFLSNGNFAIIFNIAPESLRSISTSVELILNELYSLTQTIVTAGAGAPAKSIFDLPLSYRQAEDALLYRTLDTKGHLVFYQDVGDPDPLSNIYSSMTQPPLFKECLTNGYYSEASDILDKIFDDLKNETIKVNFQQAKYVYEMLLSDAFHILQDSKTENVNAGISEDPFKKLVGMQSIDMIHNYLKSLLSIWFTRSVSLSESNPQDTISRIKKIVEAEYGRDINLNIVAEKMEMNASYLSRLFKTSQGISFIDYLTDVRMKNAKELLKTTQWNVAEIAAKVGYSDSNYFTRLFKKKNGLTPGEYRRISK